MISHKGFLIAGLIVMSSVSAEGWAKSVTVSDVVSLQTAVKSVQPGDTIWVKGGKYQFTSRLNLLVSGKPDRKICLFAQNSVGGQRPVFDGAAMEVKSSNQVVKLQASYWHIKGLDITKAGDNGMWVTAASNNVIENCRFYENNDTGLQLDKGSSNNHVLNCDSYANADPKVENADGFACKMDVGSGNTFTGCRAWNNLDDGWDGYLRDTDNVNTKYVNCWAFANGVKVDGTPTGGDGNGFKTGGSDDKLKKHHATFTNCIAVGNLADGFDHNSNRGKVVIDKCYAASNKNNFNFSDTNPLDTLVVTNCTVIGKPGKLLAAYVEVKGNSWQAGNVATTPLLIDIKDLMTARDNDGTLPRLVGFAQKQ